MDRLNTSGIEPGGRRAQRSSVRYAVLVLFVLALLGGVVQAVHIHQQDGRWALVSAAAPERLTVAGRDYRRGEHTRAYADWVKRGTTSGGGTIYVLPDSLPTPTVLWVRKGTKVWEYDLIGGP